MPTRPGSASRTAIDGGFDSMTTTARRLTTGLLLGTCALALSACGPTYGTGVSQGQQMVNDIDGIFTLGSTNRSEISYAPRPELVRPASIGALPPPRAGTAAAANANWPQSPEVIRARTLAAADATRGDGVLPPNFNPSQGDVGAEPETRANAIDREGLNASWLSPAELRGQRQQVIAQRGEQQGNPTQRRYLSEPPVVYRAPAATAPVGDTGVDEDVKERRSEGTRSLGSRIREAMPF